MFVVILVILGKLKRKLVKAKMELEKKIVKMKKRGKTILLSKLLYNLRVCVCSFVHPLNFSASQKVTVLCGNSINSKQK